MVAPRQKQAPANTVAARLSMGDFGISDLWEIAQRRWLSLAVFLFLAWAGGVAYIAYAQKVYESVAQVLVMRKDPRLVDRAKAAGGSESDVSEDLLATHMQLVASKRTIESALEMDQLTELPSILENLEKDLVTGLPEQTPAEYVMDNLEVTRGGAGQARQAHVLMIAFQHPHAEDARRVLDAIVKSYQTFLNEKFADVNKEAASLIQKASVDFETELATAEEEYQKFREQSPILMTGEEGTNVYRLRYEEAQRELSSIQLALTQARARLETREQSYAALKLQKNAPPLAYYALVDDANADRLAKFLEVEAIKAQNDPDIQIRVGTLLADKSAEAQGDAKTKYEILSRMMAERAGKASSLGESHPEVKSMDAAVDSFKKFLGEEEKARLVREQKRKEIENAPTMASALLQSLEPIPVMDSYLSMLRNDVSTLERREQALLEIAATEEEEAKSLIVFENEGAKLKAQVVHAQTLYDTVLDRLNEINLAKDFSGFINEVIESPEVGEEVWPSIPIVMILATLVGLMFGSVLAGFREYQDRSFRDPEEIRRELDLPLLTHVPDLRNRRNEAVVEGSAIDGSISAYHRPKSREAEVFRGLRTSLFFSSNGRKCQVVEFTSPNQGDGKSTVIANLSISIAQTGRKVLMIDCDLRRPNVHRLLGLKNDVGLTDVIVGDVEPWDAVQQTETTNLWAMPSGPLPANPAELLTSSTFEQFLALAREKFDYILLDCPPVLAVADPCIVAPRADGVALVLRVAKDSRPQAARAKEMLMRVGANLIGVVVNASQEATRMGYGKYGDSAHAYSYDYNQGNGKGYNKYYQSEEDAAKTVGNAARR